jgi:hypothetical protein
MSLLRLLAPAAALLFAVPAAAEPLRDFCADRPGLGTPPCTIDPSHVAVEIGLADWTIDDPDTVELGQILVRVGLDERTEVQFGGTLLGLVGDRSGIGDVTVALRRNLVNPDGSGFSAALMPYASLPTGGEAIGAGTWSGGLLLPLSYDLGSGLQFGLTGQVEAAADEDRSGRHLAYGGVAGLSFPAGDTLSATVELSATRDRDSTEWLAGVSAAWLAKAGFQLDVGANLGLDKAAPDIELYAGIAKRF